MDLITLKQNVKKEMEMVFARWERDIAMWAERDDQDMVDMIKDDIAYNESVLEQFIDDDDIDGLLNRLYSQDTAPREEFYKVFDMLDDFREVVNI